MTHDDATAARSEPALDHLALLADAQDAFAAELTTADPEAPVAACAPWHVADLALHLGGVHWWAAAMALSVNLEGADASRPRSTPALVAFYRWAAAHLRTTLDEVGPDAPAFTLLGAGPASFWRRRQLHETLVHLVDLRMAVGLSPAQSGRGVAPAVWADTVDEVVTVMHPRQVRLGRAPAPAVAVDLVATDTETDAATGIETRSDTDTTWRIGPADGPADAHVEGPAWSLALLVWGRLAVDDDALTITGALSAVTAVLDVTLVP